MGTSSKESAVLISTRLKREDCNRTKHDSVFSDWKVLIGPSDWEDHFLGKEGAERYRVHNLPNCSSCSGLYELGVAIPRSSSSHETSKVDSNCIIPVYLGQAENVRTRLQHYGREGAHLENGKSTGDLNCSSQQGLGLFTDIFARRCSVVYRWAPMNNKKHAEKTEAQLLDTFDYAWNKGSNGARRPNDILQKLDRTTLLNTRFPGIVKKLLIFQEKKKGIKIEAGEPFLMQKDPNSYSNEDNNDLLSRILKIGRSRPRLVSVKYGFDESNAIVCGVALGHGSVCTSVPVEGRKRCAEHKGMKVNGLTSKLMSKEKSTNGKVITGLECDGYLDPSFSCDKVNPQPVADTCPADNNGFLICGIILDDGSLCRKLAVRGRKRCEEHKGRKISRSRKPYTLDSAESPVMSETGTICGVDLKNGTVCSRPPVVGRKRCEEHKGMSVTGSKSMLPAEDTPIGF